MALDTNRSDVIAEQNDKVRKAIANPELLIELQREGFKFKLVWTSGIDDLFLKTGKFENLATAIAEFDDFSEDNNPHGERDFGALEIEGTRIFFKIDYYNLTLDGGSEDPTDTAQTMRVLTLLLPSEY
jgi:hypothetical protein